MRATWRKSEPVSLRVLLIRQEKTNQLLMFGGFGSIDAAAGRDFIAQSWQGIN